MLKSIFTQTSKVEQIGNYLFAINNSYFLALRILNDNYTSARLGNLEFSNVSFMSYE